MDIIAPLLVGIFVLYIVVHVCRSYLISRREKIIDALPFPATISSKVQQHYPHLSTQEVTMVMRGLREYFQVCNIAGRKTVAMPSQAVDVAWHEFILFTKTYDHFCRRALGRFLHHTPAEAMTSPLIAQNGIKRAWKISCFREKIESKKPSRLPFLFALDRDLAIPDGFKYTLDCSKRDDDSYCAGHIGCGSGCGSGCSSGSDGCSSGCGGD